MEAKTEPGLHLPGQTCALAWGSPSGRHCRLVAALDQALLKELGANLTLSAASLFSTALGGCVRLLGRPHPTP